MEPDRRAGPGMDPGPNQPTNKESIDMRKSTGGNRRRPDRGIVALIVAGVLVLCVLAWVVVFFYLELR